jgi:hypothetical protein
MIIQPDFLAPTGAVCINCRDQYDPRIGGLIVPRVINIKGKHIKRGGPIRTFICAPCAAAIVPMMAEELNELRESATLEIVSEK